MKTARLFFAAVCILILFAVSSCSRPALIVQIESEAPPLISAAEASPETVRIQTNAEVTPLFSDTAGGGSSQKDISVEVFVSLKHVPAAGSSDVTNIAEESFSVGETFENPYQFVHDVSGGEMENGHYWVEFLWIDDGGYNIQETETAVYPDET